MECWRYDCGSLISEQHMLQEWACWCAEYLHLYKEWTFVSVLVFFVVVFFVHVELLFILRWHHLSPVGPENHLGSENPLVLLQSWPQSKKDMVAEMLTHHAYTCLAVKCIWIPLKVLSWSYEGKFSLIFHKQTNMTNRWYKNLSQL